MLTFIFLVEFIFFVKLCLEFCNNFAINLLVFLLLRSWRNGRRAALRSLFFNESGSSSLLDRTISNKNMNNSTYDAIIIGAGAAGLMAAATAAKKGKKTLLLEKTNKIGEKIRISGGGRCNFTNLNISSNNYLSQNLHFVKSALAQYNQHDFIKLVESYNIAYHEKTLGQLFCNHSSQSIIDMLVNECYKYGAEIILECEIDKISKDDLFYLDNYQTKNLIIASGGLSIPKIGATDFGYKIAKQFNINIIPTKPALVPLLTKEKYTDLAGISIASVVSYDKTNFKENILFTHKGLSGPAILQISSYIKNPDNDKISINLLPDVDLHHLFTSLKNSKIYLSNFLKEYLPNRFVDIFMNNIPNKKLIEYKNIDLTKIANDLHKFIVEIAGSEGYLKAEVTSGGIDTNELSSKTMESKKIPGLYFIGEVVDVTGWLGGYNFQWAWSSGFAAGSTI